MLGGEPLMTGWWPNVAEAVSGVAAPGGILVRWVVAESDEAAFKVLQDIPADAWIPDGISIRVGDAQLYLIDTTCTGSELGADEYLVIDLPSGIYSIDTAHYKPDEETYLLLHRLTREDGAAT